MNIKKRERYLLEILITVLICFVYYQFIYINQAEALNSKEIERVEIEARYNEAMKNINNIEEEEEKAEILKTSVFNKAEKLYPSIMQEKIIIELDKLLNDSKLTANVAFSPVEVTSIEKLLSKEVIEEESSLQALIDQYSDNNVNENNNIDTESEGNDDTEVIEEEESQEVESTESDVTVERLKVAINFSGNYNSLKKFIYSVENYEREIVITNISISAKSENQLTGVMNLEFHAIPKLSDVDEDYLNWTINNVYGKEVLFSAGKANGAYSSTIEEQNNEEDINDFAMMVRSSLSELPTATIGKANDETTKTYIYSDNEKIEEIEVLFNEEKGKIYYKYKNSNSNYPKDNSSKGEEFTSKSEDIVLEIISEERLEASDLAGVKLTIVNNTSKKVEVIVINDDTSNPRVAVISEGNTVNVTRK